LSFIYIEQVWLIEQFKNYVQPVMIVKSCVRLLMMSGRLLLLFYIFKNHRVIVSLCRVKI